MYISKNSNMFPSIKSQLQYYTVRAKDSHLSVYEKSMLMRKKDMETVKRMISQAIIDKISSPFVSLINQTTNSNYLLINNFDNISRLEML